jgi:hypothetical protein
MTLYLVFLCSFSLYFSLTFNLSSGAVFYFVLLIESTMYCTSRSLFSWISLVILGCLVYRSIASFNESIDLGIAHRFTFSRPIALWYYESINDTEIVVRLSCDNIVISALFFRYFNTRFVTWDASYSDSNDFIFSILKVDLRTTRIEAIDLSGLIQELQIVCWYYLWRYHYQSS